MATIIGHRGYWLNPTEANSLTAFERSFTAGFGVEADVRDHGGQLVISHDPPIGEEMPLNELLASHASHPSPGPLALNIKADGLYELLRDSIAAYGISNWFAFDMSVPDCVVYSRHDVPFFTRMSEHETTPVLYEQSIGVWIDPFQREWFDDATLREHLDAGKRICIVSPELHGRDPEAAWELWRTWPSFASDRVAVCTDHPRTLSERLPL